MVDNARLVLITGATGYVGTAVATRIAKKYRVRAVDTQLFGNAIADVPNIEFGTMDIQNEQAIRRAMFGVTDVIHLAGVVTDELVDMNHAKAIRVNVLGTEIVTQAAFDFGVKRFVYASSSSVYGAQDEVCTEESTPRPQSVYAATKLVGEDIVNRYGRRRATNGNMSVVSVRSSTCCGPSPRMRLDTIVNIFSKQAYYDGKITVWDGSQYRTNAHIDDVARLYEFLLDAPAEKINGEAFNFTSGNHTAEELAEIVRKTVILENTVKLAPHTYGAQNVEVTIDKSKVDKRSYRMNASKLERVLGFKPEKTIEDAVRDNIAYFKSGKMGDPNSDLYLNTKRMAGVMKE